MVLGCTCVLSYWHCTCKSDAMDNVEGSCRDKSHNMKIDRCVVHGGDDMINVDVICA